MAVHRGLVAAAIAVVSFGAVGAATATTTRSYRNCTALNRVYPHGVGRSGAHDRTATGQPVRNFKVSNRLYAQNDGKRPLYRGEHDLDRDNDGVACEKH
jgi:Excalibur calcium-binding domain